MVDLMARSPTPLTSRRLLGLRRRLRRRPLLAITLATLVIAAATSVIALAVTPSASASPVEVGFRTLTLIDRSRTARLPGSGTQPRIMTTEVFYPALGSVGTGDVHDAPAARTAGPYPLVIFGQGFGPPPGYYVRLLDALARAGYVVAAPRYPFASLGAQGSPAYPLTNEADQVNQPGDDRFVITEMLAQSARANTPFSGLINPRRIAVSGQSDGGDAALAVAFDPALHDPRVGAAVIFSGAEIPELGAFAFPTHGPPLLATQGSDDTINLPAATAQFFTGAPRPKFLLTLIGAMHLPPYHSQQPQLGIVASVTIAFLDRYLKGQHAGLRRMQAVGDVPGVATLSSNP
jgi:dienelactone hydrolase